MKPNPRWPAARCALGAWALAALLTGCATPAGMAIGTPIEQVRAYWLKPTGEYTLPGGGTRLEYAQGSFGRETIMMDFDVRGLLVSSRQVRTEANFAHIVPGMASSEVRLRLGRPSEVFGAGWVEKIHVWNYRFPGGDCVWFQVSIVDATQLVSTASIGSDPVCDGRNDKTARR